MMEKITRSVWVQHTVNGECSPCIPGGDCRDEEVVIVR